MSGNLSPILAKSDEMKNCKNQYVKRIMQVWVYNRGNLSPLVLTESEQSEA